MKLSARMFFASFLIVAVCFAFPIWWVLDTLRLRYQESVEELLVDQANVLAAMVGRETEQGQLDFDEWRHAFDHAYARPLAAQIYTLTKTHVDLSVLVTDMKGVIQFDSKNPENETYNFSKWNLVKTTLTEEYGAKMTRLYAGTPSTRLVYVAAPIFVKGKLTGAVLVGKPMTNINRFLEHAKPQIFKVGAISAGVAIVLSFFFSRLLTRPIKRLTHYANDVRDGKRVPFPRLDSSEIGEMGEAFQRMQEALEGKKYVEQYVQNLTHELKSPLSAIRGAAELLEEPDMPEETRSKFLANIQDSATRIQQIVDHLLELAALENRKILETVEDVSLNALIQAVLESKRPLLSQKNLTCAPQIEEDATLRGDAFLLQQALSNLLQNAIEFSPASGSIEFRVRRHAERLHIIIEDGGPGLPDFAKEKVFDKFFSLQRPDTGKKSTGLGLNFVKEIAHLHHGAIALENRSDAPGARAVLSLPVSG